MAETKEINIWAIVPSAGSGQRMQQSIPKQYLELHGRAVIEHTLSTLLSEARINSVIVCIAENDPYWPKLDCAHESNVFYTRGGATRSRSVFNGIKALAEQANKQDWVLVHDAARPCLSQAMLSAFIDQLIDDEVGGILALPSNDTVKQATSSEAESKIECTLDRSRIWYAQTPQMFRYGLLKKALKRAIKKDADITDEASAMERAGYRPRLIPGERRNLKITQPDDLELANLLIE